MDDKNDTIEWKRNYNVDDYNNDYLLKIIG